MNRSAGRYVSFVVAACCVISLNAMAAINVTWGTSTGNLKDSSSVLLHGNSTTTGYTLGPFIQLIWTGGDGLISSFDATSLTGIAAGADDKIVATAWVGKGIFPPGDGGGKNGVFSDTSSISFGTSTGSTFYVRFFDTISPNYASGYVPTSGKYSNISDAGWTITQGNVDTGIASFNISSSQLALISIVPEPSSVALMGLGLAMFALRRKFLT